MEHVSSLCCFCFFFETRHFVFCPPLSSFKAQVAQPSLQTTFYLPVVVGTSDTNTVDRGSAGLCLGNDRHRLRNLDPETGTSKWDSALLLFTHVLFLLRPVKISCVIKSWLDRIWVLNPMKCQAGHIVVAHNNFSQHQEMIACLEAPGFRTKGSRVWLMQLVMNSLKPLRSHDLVLRVVSCH